MKIYNRAASFALAIAGLAASGNAQAFVDPNTNNAYEIVSGGGTFAQRQAASVLRVFSGRTGHLATITSAAEALFLNTTFGGGLGNVMIGAFQTPGSSSPSSGWNWVTGEAWSYTNWNGGEPNDGGDGVENGAENFATFFPGAAGRWNDTPDSYGSAYMVEYDAVPEPSTLAVFGGSLALFVRRRFKKSN